MRLDGVDQGNGGITEEKEEEEEVGLERYFVNKQKAGESTNHGNDLEEGGDEEEVDKEQSEEQGGVRPGLLPLTQGDLRASE